MGALISSCPETWRVIETGIETDDATMAKLRFQSVRVDCPHCQRTHTLKIKDCHLFKRRPRQSQVHSPGMLCDEVNVGAVIQRAQIAKSHDGK